MKISLFIITKENVSLITSEYVVINLTLTIYGSTSVPFNLLYSSPATAASLL